MRNCESVGPDQIIVPLLSVVVCTYNRTKLLPACLDGLMSQTIQEQVQIIVIDDGSTEDTASIVTKYEVEFVALDRNQGLSAARNVGISLAQASVVAFTDDDVVVPPDWCESMMQAWAMAPSGTCAIGGAVSVAEVSSLTQRYLTRHNPLSPIEMDVAYADTFVERLRAYLKSETREDPSVRTVYSLVGANMSFARDALFAVGGFDPSIRFGGDEEFVCVNLRKTFGDQAIVFNPSIIVAHHFDAKLSDTLRRSFSYGSSNGRAWARDGGIPGLRPVGVLFTVSLVFIAPITFTGAVLISLLIPIAMWRRWVRTSLFERNPEIVSYPYLALAQELCANIGFFVGWVRERRRIN